MSSALHRLLLGSRSRSDSGSGEGEKPDEHGVVGGGPQSPLTTTTARGGDRDLRGRRPCLDPDGPSRLCPSSPRSPCSPRSPRNLEARRLRPRDLNSSSPSLSPPNRSLETGGYADGNGSVTESANGSASSSVSGSGSGTEADQKSPSSPMSPLARKLYRVSSARRQGLISNKQKSIAKGASSPRSANAGMHRRSPARTQTVRRRRSRDRAAAGATIAVATDGIISSRRTPFRHPFRRPNF